MITKPDRWERETVRVCWIDIMGKRHVHIDTVIKLLRNEQKAVVRMVKDQYRFANEMGLSKQGYKDLLIKMLHERAK